MKDRPRIVIITGPTATGKSQVALEVAKALSDRGRPACIVSADSVQVYKHMDIGTDKLPPEVREEVTHHLIDVVLPDQTFSAAEFGKRAHEIIDETWQKGGAPVIAGGTGFYLRTLLGGLFPGPSAHADIREKLYGVADRNGIDSLHKRLGEIDPEAAGNIHPNDHVRIIRALEVYEVTGEPISSHFARQKEQGPRYHVLMIGLFMERDRMYEKINSRVVEMIERGLVDEVKSLREMGYGPQIKSQHALGYKQVHMMLDGSIDLERATYLIQRDTRHYSRRQLTWFRKEKSLEWMPVEDRVKVIERAVGFMEDGI